LRSYLNSNILTKSNDGKINEKSDAKSIESLEIEEKIVKIELY